MYNFLFLFQSPYNHDCLWTPHISNHDYVGRSLDIKPCASVTPHINNNDYVGRPLDIKPCASVTPHINNYDYVGRPLEMPVPSKGHYGYIVQLISGDLDKGIGKSWIHTVLASWATSLSAVDYVRLHVTKGTVGNNNYDYVGRPLEMPVPSQGHYGFHSFPVVDWFCLFI
jgi:hypothetical protein